MLSGRGGSDPWVGGSMGHMGHFSGDPWVGVGQIFGGNGGSWVILSSSSRCVVVPKYTFYECKVGERVGGTGTETETYRLRRQRHTDILLFDIRCARFLVGHGSPMHR